MRLTLERIVGDLKTYKMEEKMKIFRDLTKEEEGLFRHWARENYKPLSPINGIWHPVVQDECRKINEEGDQKETLLPGTFEENLKKIVSAL